MLDNNTNHYTIVPMENQAIVNDVTMTVEEAMEFDEPMSGEETCVMLPGPTDTVQPAVLVIPIEVRILTKFVFLAIIPRG